MTQSSVCANPFYQLSVGHSVTGGLFIHVPFSLWLILVQPRYILHTLAMSRLLHLVLLGLLAALALFYSTAAG